MSEAHANQRRTPRKRAHCTTMITDVISGKSLGQLGNLSSGGMLLIGQHTPRNEGLYQISMALPESGQLLNPQPIELGVQEQWHTNAASPGRVWAGFRIIAISDADEVRLDSWLAET